MLRVVELRGVFLRSRTDSAGLVKTFATTLILIGIFIFLGGFFSWMSESWKQGSIKRTSTPSLTTTLVPSATHSTLRQVEMKPEISLDGQNNSKIDQESVSDDELDQWLRKASVNPSQAVIEILTMRSDARRKTLLEWVLSAWFSDGADEALVWASSYLADPTVPHGNALVSELVWASVQDSALATLTWIRSDLPEPYRAFGERELAVMWSTLDPAAMADWLQATPRDETASFWIEELIQGFSASDPLMAIQWTDQLADANIASEYRQSVLQSWILQDRDAAAAWISEDNAREQAYGGILNMSEFPD